MNDQQPVQLRVALAQVDTRVGDLAGNAELGDPWTAKAAEDGAHLVVFPEMTLTGYPAEDLVLRESFAQASEHAVVDLAASLAEQGLGDVAVVVGYLAHTEGSGPAPVDHPPVDDADRPGDANPRRGAPRNAAALLYGGEVVVRYYKRHLPNYGVFDEARYFVPGTELPIVRLHGIDVALTICEDLWVEGGPCGVAGQAGVDLVVSPNASPYERAKDDLRLPLVRRRAAEAHAPVVYCNQVGGQDELVFDGDSLVVSAGRRAARPRPAVRRAPADRRPDARPGAVAERRDGRIGPMTVTRHLLSGGAGGAFEARPARSRSRSRTARRSGARWSWGCATSSTRTACPRSCWVSPAASTPPWSPPSPSTPWAPTACTASGCRRSTPASTPSTTPRTWPSAPACTTRVVPIAPMVDAYHGSVELSGVAAENLQARVRGTLLMGLSNQHGHLLLTTGNKSEVAVGYSTLYGDSGRRVRADQGRAQDAGLGARPLAQRVRPPAAARPSRSRRTPSTSRRRPSSPPASRTPTRCPPTRSSTPSSPTTSTATSAWPSCSSAGTTPRSWRAVLRLVDTAEFKRRQSAPGTKISLKAFGRDRRLPITNRWRETLPSVREGAATT